MADRSVALITGASSGIGRATAEELASRGYRVALLARSEQRLQEVRAAIADQGGEAMSVVCDVTSAQSLQDAASTVFDQWGRLDAVVANAGVEVTGDVLQTTEESWRMCIDTNLTGTFLLAKATLPLLLEQPTSAFVAVASDLGTAGSQDFAAYTASKHGMVGLVRCMALDFAFRGLRANAVCPSLVVTPMFDRLTNGADEAELRMWTDMLPNGRFAMPEEVAKAVAHLAGPEASYTNGMVYALDGGATAGYYSPRMDPGRS